MLVVIGCYAAHPALFLLQPQPPPLCHSAAHALKPQSSLSPIATPCAKHCHCLPCNSNRHPPRSHSSHAMCPQHLSSSERVQGGLVRQIGKIGCCTTKGRGSADQLRGRGREVWGKQVRQRLGSNSGSIVLITWLASLKIQQ